MVVRSGLADLGKWVSDERDLYEDYKMHIGRQHLAARRVAVPASTRGVPIRGHADFAAGRGAAEALRSVCREPGPECVGQAETPTVGSVRTRSSRSRSDGVFPFSARCGRRSLYSDSHVFSAARSSEGVLKENRA
jgi:hypothetical protein